MPPTRADAEKRAGIIILGMHRGGTSLTASIFGQLGCSYGGQLVEADPDNPVGYWEHAEIVTVHDNFLALIRSTWDDPRRISKEAFHSTEASIARKRLASVFERDFGQENFWVLKDPRQCRLLPLWDEILEGAGDTIRYLHVLRNPYAVSESLAARDKLSLPHSLLLWLRHNLESERATRGTNRTWISFEDLISDPDRCIRRACERIGITHLPNMSALGTLGGIVEPSLIHHRGFSGNSPNLEETYPWVSRALEVLEGLCQGEDERAYSTLDELDKELLRADRMYFYDSDHMQPHLSRKLNVSNVLSDTKAKNRLAAQVDGIIEFVHKDNAYLQEIHDFLSKLPAISEGQEALYDSLNDLTRRLSRERITENNLLGKSLDLIAELDTDRKETIERYTRLRDAHEKIGLDYEDLTHDNERLRTELRNFKQENDQLRRHLEIERREYQKRELAFEERLRSELVRQRQSFYDSRSWKASAPLRLIGRTLFKTDQFERKKR